MADPRLRAIQGEDLYESSIEYDERYGTVAIVRAANEIGELDDAYKSTLCVLHRGAGRGYAPGARHFPTIRTVPQTYVVLP